MDEQVLNELLECSVCLERLDESSKVLPCQHTFCRRCLDEIVSTKKELRCPECRSLVETPVDVLMSNILLIRLLEGLKNAKSGIGVSVAGPSVSPNSQGSPRGPASPTHPSHSPVHAVGPSASCISRTSPAHRIITPAQPCCKALYNYDAKEPGDLSFKKGDLILLRKQVDENWYHGELRGQHGFFPATYVQVITALPEEVPKCKALYDFMVCDKNEKDCLTFRKDETVVVIRRVDENWAEGKISERIGIFPISFVEMNDAAKWLINNPAIANRSAVGSPQSNNSSNSPTSPPREGLPESTSTPSSLVSLILPSTSNMPSVTSCITAPMINPSLMAVQRAGQKRHSLTAISTHKGTSQQPSQQHHRHSMELSGTNFAAELSMSTNGEQMSTSQPASLTSSPKTTASQLPQGSTGANCDVVLTSIYVALYNYKPRKEDEVDLKKGEYYTVSEKCQDGWFKGTCLRSGATGVFPGNYVQQVKFTKHPNGGSGRVGAVQTVRPSGIPGKANHVTVSRAHSFPKTSPMAMVSGEYQVKVGSQGIITRPPNVTVSYVPPQPSSSHTNPAMTTSMIQTPSASSSSALGRVGGGGDPMSASTPSGQLSGQLSGQTEKAVPPRSSHSSQRSPRSSPRSTRKSERLKKDHHSRNPLHSMKSSSSITPSDAIGAVGGERNSHSSEHHKEHKERKERKEKDKLSIVKRLAKVKKSKSPPPDLCASSSHRISHSRSGSAPGDGEGATPSSQQYKSRSLEHHQKSKSLDSNTHPPSTKQIRTKPLLRERFRCVVPYPPQSEIELELKPGDIVYVHKKRDDGWYKGTLQRSGKTGLFPGSFVETF